MNWREQVEAQIRRARNVITDSPQKNTALTKALDSAEALLDVAIAAEWTRHPNGREQDGFDLDAALDKLREVGDVD